MFKSYFSEKRLRNRKTTRVRNKSLNLISKTTEHDFEATPGTVIQCRRWRGDRRRRDRRGRESITEESVGIVLSSRRDGAVAPGRCPRR